MTGPEEHPDLSPEEAERLSKKIGLPVKQDQSDLRKLKAGMKNAVLVDIVPGIVEPIPLPKDSRRN